MVLIHSQPFTYRLNSVLYTKSQRKILKDGGGSGGSRGEGGGCEGRSDGFV